MDEKQSFRVETPPPHPNRLRRRGHFLATAIGALGLYGICQCIPNDNPPIDDPTPIASDNNICLTPDCVHAASEILYNLSPYHKNIDPCTDFEELVCGGWRDRHDLRPDQGDAFTGTEMVERGQLLLRHILESEDSDAFGHVFSTDDDKADRKNFEKLRSAYDACLDEDSVKKSGVSPIKPLLSEVALAMQDPSSDKIAHKAGLILARYGITPLVATGTGPDDRDPDTVVVSVSAPDSFGLPSKERYEDENLVQKYRAVVIEVLGEIFPDAKENSRSAVVDLERRLAAASPPTEDRENVTVSTKSTLKEGRKKTDIDQKTYNPMALDTADKMAPEAGTKHIVEGLKPTKLEVHRVINMSPEYFQSLSKIISETGADTLSLYFLWKTVQSFSSSIEADEIKPYKRFMNELSGKDPESTPERWRKCVSHVDDGLGWLLSRFFVEKAFSPEAKDFGNTIIGDIKQEFVRKLQKTDWMDDSTTERAIKKVHNIIQKIGYPTSSPDVSDADELKQYYKQVKVSSDDFFGNGAEMRKFQIDREWNALGKPVDRDEWGMTVPTVNAYYNPPGNEIVFPAGIMQFPVFDVKVPAYLSYGAFGAVAGHELSHAFDSTGRKWDETGNLTDWWSQSTVDAFQEKAQCFIDQYANFTVDGPDDKPLHVNGRLTLGENLADAGGLSASFQSWKRRAAETPNDDLPGLSTIFSQEQLFFVSYSNWWCGKSRKDAAIGKIYTDPHAPKWARILGTMANSREFREVFECPVKEPTCELW